MAYLALIELDVPNACLIHSREIAEQMVELGHEVEMFLPLPLKRQRWPAVHHQWVRFWGFDARRRFLFLIEACARLWWENRKKPFDFIYLREIEAAGPLIFLCRALSLPLFVEVNGWLLDDLNLIGATPAQMQKAQRNQNRLMQAACGVIASTVGNADKIKECYGIRHVMTQELGVNSELFARVDKQAARQALGFSNDTKVILFAGSFHPHHDLCTLIKAFAGVQKELPEVRLVLVGTGPQWPAVKRWISQEGVAASVDLAGSQAYEDMPDWFAASDLVVSPLIHQKVVQQNGAFATKVWEAMAAGTRVLVTDLPDTMSYPLLSKLSWVSPPEDVAGMTHAMLEAIGARADVGDGREARAQAYVLQERSWRKAAEETLVFIKQCLGRN